MLIANNMEMESSGTRQPSVLDDGGSTRFADQEEHISCLGSPLVDHRMPMDWTDEKHNLYLKSMEASFVDQLYNSFDLVGCHPQKENPSVSRPSSQMLCKARTSSAQFKVLRSGFWQRINFERAQKQMAKADGSRVLLASPWIQHFKSLCRDEAVALPNLQRHGASKSKAVLCRGKMASPCGLATTSKQFPMYHSHLFQRESIGTNEEVSDQNFLNDDGEGRGESCRISARRVKTVVVDSCINDQVVPSDRCPADATLNNVPAI